MSYFVLFFITISLAISCGRNVSNFSATTSIINDGKDTIVKVDPQNNGIFQNIYRLTMDGIFIGTAFSIGSRSELFTNAHVILLWNYKCNQGRCPELIASNSFRSLTISKLMMSDKRLDIAVIQYEESGFDHIKMKLSHELNTVVDDEIIVVGFDEYGLVKSTGKVRGSNYSSTNKPSFHYDADTLSGMSGSPVFNMKMELVGIHFGNPRSGVLNRAIPITSPSKISTYPTF